jgi:hypothetical protein
MRRMGLEAFYCRPRTATPVACRRRLGDKRDGLDGSATDFFADNSIGARVT